MWFAAWRLDMQAGSPAIDKESVWEERMCAVRGWGYQLVVGQFVVKLRRYGGGLGRDGRRGIPLAYHLYGSPCA